MTRPSEGPLPGGRRRSREAVRVTGCGWPDAIFVNLGAYVDSGHRGGHVGDRGSADRQDVHLSGGVGIGGVLEPLQANPTIIEDNALVGARSEVVEGVVGEGSVLAMGPSSAPRRSRRPDHRQDPHGEVRPTRGGVGPLPGKPFPNNEPGPSSIARSSDGHRQKREPRPHQRAVAPTYWVEMGATAAGCTCQGCIKRQTGASHGAVVTLSDKVIETIRRLRRADRIVERFPGAAWVRCARSCARGREFGPGPRRSRAANAPRVATLVLPAAGLAARVDRGFSRPSDGGRQCLQRCRAWTRPPIIVLIGAGVLP